jgi:hypothetical protein
MLEPRVAEYLIEELIVNTRLLRGSHTFQVEWRIIQCVILVRE